MRRGPLTPERILALADFHRRCTGRWPSVTSGPVRGARGDSWRSINNALRYGLRGMPGGSSLALFLAERRGARNRTSLPRLTVRRILSWADAHRARTGKWPTMDSGPVVDASGETWAAVDGALKTGGRGLPGGDSLGRLLARRRGADNHTNIPPLTVEQILAWADAHHARTGQWPNYQSGTVADAPRETWARISSALHAGTRGLAGGTTLYRLLKRYRQIPGPRPPARRVRVQHQGPGRPGVRINFPDEVLERYCSGELDTAAVAGLCGVSRPVAARELRRAGVTAPPRGRPPGKRPNLHAQVVRRYRRGQTIPEVASGLGLTRARVSTILRRYGVARRPAGPVFFAPDLSAEGLRQFAARLKERRRAAGLTQDDLVAKVGLSQGTLSALENGRQSPTRKTVAKLARALGVRPKELFGGS